MADLSRLTRWLTRADTVAAPPASMRSTPDKVEFHIARFRRAIEQCEKGLRRRAELQANLDYWLAIQAAEKALNQ